MLRPKAGVIAFELLAGILMKYPTWVCIPVASFALLFSASSFAALGHAYAVGQGSSDQVSSWEQLSRDSSCWRD
jgi:hypothetical protein